VWPSYTAEGGDLLILIAWDEDFLQQGCQVLFGNVSMLAWQPSPAVGEWMPLDERSGFISVQTVPE